MKKSIKEQPGTQSKLSTSADSGLLLKYAGFWLLLAVVLVYAKSLSLTGLTQLDDSIFIFDKQEFNKHFSNIIQSFRIGCFNEKDFYYRPLFLASFILEYPLAGHSFRFYHVVNLLFHGANVLLLFALLKKLNVVRHVAFVLSLIFAVHPVLTMAVAWIPGYNDLLLTFFTFLFLHAVISYSAKPKPFSFILQFLLYLLCLFTKETAVFIPFVTALLFYCEKKESLLQKKYYFLIASWLTALTVWYLMRNEILPPSSHGIINVSLLDNFWQRLPGLLQYLGKIFLPFNLSVFPTIQETSFMFGIAALLIVIIIIFLNKERDNRMVLLGASWFIFFIIPFFFVPKGINDQLFEHRLYLPIVGILILLSQSVVFHPKFQAKRVLRGGILVSAVFALITFNYIGRFDNDMTFWSAAANDSPHSAYANKMYGIKLAERKMNTEALPYIKKSYEIDSTQRYVNLFLARLIYLPVDSLKQAERCLKNEVRLNPSYADTYFELAHLYFRLNDLQNAKVSLEKFLSFRPREEPANSNLLRLYFDLKDYVKAKEQIDHMEQMGLTVDQNIKAGVNAATPK